MPTIQQNGTVIIQNGNRVVIQTGTDKKVIISMRGAPGVARQDIGFSIPGNFPYANEVIFRFAVARENSFDETLSIAAAYTAPTVDYSLKIKRTRANTTVDVGTITFASGSKTGVIDFTDSAQLRGDVFTLVTPGIANLDITDIAITLAGSN